MYQHNKCAYNRLCSVVRGRVKDVHCSINVIPWPAYHNFPVERNYSTVVANIAQRPPNRLLIKTKL